MTFLRTDAPSDYIATAEVDIGRVELLPSEDSAGAPVLLSEDGTDGFVNLLDFRDAATMPQAQTGIKLNLRDQDETDDFEIVPGETVLVLDFDVSQSFVLRGNPETPAGVHGVNFKPTLRVTVRDVAASISGVISTMPEGIDVEGLTVRATPLDAGDVDFEIVEDLTGTISGAVTTMLGGVSVEGLTVTATPAAEGADRGGRGSDRHQLRDPARLTVI